MLFEAQRGEPELPRSGGSEESIYIGNVRSRVFHRENCEGLPSERNRVVFHSLSEAYEEGYSPCSSCRP